MTACYLAALLVWVRPLLFAQRFFLVGYVAKSKGSHGGCLCFDAGLEVYAGEGWFSPKPGLRPPSGLRTFWVSPPPLPGSARAERMGGSSLPSMISLISLASKVSRSSRAAAMR